MYLGTRWRYEIRWYGGGDLTRRNNIVVESKPRSNALTVSVSAWLNVDDFNARVTAEQPLIVYAQVTLGNSPVQGAKVTASVLTTLANGTVVTAADPFDLLDNGSGGEQAYLLICCLTFNYYIIVL